MLMDSLSIHPHHPSERHKQPALDTQGRAALAQPHTLASFLQISHSSNVRHRNRVESQATGMKRGVNTTEAVPFCLPETSTELRRQGAQQPQVLPHLCRPEPHHAAPARHHGPGRPGHLAARHPCLPVGQVQRGERRQHTYPHEYR